MDKLDRENLVNDILDDFKRRQIDRKHFENLWLTNINFYIGNQYFTTDEYGVPHDFTKQYFWQEHEVFNHIAPLVDVRLSKLARVRPTMTIVPYSDSDDDIYKANISRKILDVVTKEKNISGLISRATIWSEICGTVFYKVIWDNEKGMLIGNESEILHSGDVDISVVSPFEIFPDSNTYESIEDCKSIMHVRSYNADVINEKWGLKLTGEDMDVYSLESISNLGGLGYRATNAKAGTQKKVNQVIVIEKYTAPSIENPDGRLDIVAKDQLVYTGPLPLINTITGERTYPFIKQASLTTPNCFWGTSIIDRCVPLQRALNAVKNRKHEYMNRMSMGVLTVEDGSLDTENLEEEGMSPGKILIYRQGSNPPRMLDVDSVPFDFTREETSLDQEMRDISGVSDLLSNLNVFRNISGVALELLIEQDEMRLYVTAEQIRQAMKQMSKFILALYKNYSIMERTSKLITCTGELEMFYWSGSDITFDDIVFETENEMNQTLAQKRSYIFDLLQSGLLREKDGTLSTSMKSKVLDSLGYGMWDTTQDIDNLHDMRADKENLALYEGKPVAVSEVDDHSRHIARHTSYVVSNNLDPSSNKALYDKFIDHIHEHERIQNLKENIQNLSNMQLQDNA